MSKVLQTSDIRLLLGDLAGEADLTITAATNASPSVISVTAHGLSVGDVVNINGATGNTAINGLRKVATVPTSGTFTVTDFFSGAAVNGNGSLGGTPLANRVKCNLSPGDLDDLQAALDKTSGALGPFADKDRASESSLSTIFTA